LKEEFSVTWHASREPEQEDSADASSLLIVDLVHSKCKIEFTLKSESEKVEVIRWQFLLKSGMLRTAYASQGLPLEGGVVIDLRRAGGLEDDDWWLAIYVMISRARKLQNLIILGFTEQVELFLCRGPPRNLIDITAKLQEKAALTLQALASWPAYDALH
jgi:hypothetical protein